MESKEVTAFILASFTYANKGRRYSQQETAKAISKFPEVKEVHIISGNWDLIIKVKMKDVDSIGKFVIDKLRKIKGIENTLSCMVFQTAKES